MSGLFIEDASIWIDAAKKNRGLCALFAGRMSPEASA
jgi:hypothetical protein